MTAAQLAAGGLDVNTGALERVMRACASVGLFAEDAEGRFGPTPLSEVLTASAPGSVKMVAQEVGGTWLRILGELSESIRTGEPQSHRVFGMEWWDWLNANPKELANFGEAMKANSQNSMRGVLEKCDFGGVRKIADLGGGFGHLVIALLEKYPGSQRDSCRPAGVNPGGKGEKPRPRCGGESTRICWPEYFRARAARRHLHHETHIIHDWDDEHCLRLLRNCHQSMQGAGRLICVDSVLPPMGDPSGTSAKFLDLLMMAGIRGKERTLRQWEELFTETGFRVTGVIPLQDNFGTSIVEGAKA